MIIKKRVISKILTRSAKGQSCTMNVAGVCKYNNETTVLAHVNVEGGSVGMKTDDFSACFACCECHRWLDQYLGTEEERLFYTRRAMVRTWRIWIDEKIIRV